MKYAIVGNNDGPLKLVQGLLSQKQPLPVCVGCQKRPPDEIINSYRSQPIPFFHSFDEPQLIEQLHHQDIDILINCFANFTFRKLLNLYECFNIHPSLLPSYKGRHPMHWALINGESEAGITIHGMTPKIDKGPIYWQKAVPISADDSVRILRKKLMAQLKYGFTFFMDQLRNQQLTILQNTSVSPSYFPPRTPSDSQLAEWRDPHRIYRKVKALRESDFPAYLLFEGDLRCPIRDAEWHSVKQSASTKTEVIDIEDHRILISFSDGQKIWLKGMEMNQYDYQKLQWNRPAHTSYRP